MRLFELANDVLIISMKNYEVKTEIQISAPPSKVWSALINFNHWKDWNPTVSAASGEAAVGSVLSFTMQCEGPRNGSKYSPTVTEIKKDNSLRWHAKMGFNLLFANEKVFELNNSGSGTLLVHKEVFSGLIPALFWSKISPGIRPTLEMMNLALKKKVE